MAQSELWTEAQPRLSQKFGVVCGVVWPDDLQHVAVDAEHSLWDL